MQIDTACRPGRRCGDLPTPDQPTSAEPHLTSHAQRIRRAGRAHVCVVVSAQRIRSRGRRRVCSVVSGATTSVLEVACRTGRGSRLPCLPFSPVLAVTSPPTSPRPAQRRTTSRSLIARQPSTARRPRPARTRPRHETHRYEAWPTPPHLHPAPRPRGGRRWSEPASAESGSP